MGCFLLNELGEVLLEIKSGLGFGADMRLEVNESAQSAVLLQCCGKLCHRFCS